MSTPDNNNIVDSSENPSMAKKVGLVFGKNAPHSGFNRIVIFLGIVTVCAVVYFRSGDDEVSVDARAEAEGFTYRDTKDGTVPEHVAQEEIEKDQSDADEARESGGSFVGSRPNTGKRSIDEVLNGMKAKPEPSKPVEPEPIAKAPVFKKPSNLSLDSAKGVSEVRQREQKPRNRGQEPVNPIAAYVLERQKGNYDETPEFSNGVLVAYEPPADNSDAEEPTSNETTTNQNTSPVVNTPDESDTVLAQRAGYFSYAVTITGADTDVNVNNIVGEIIGGKLDGARIIGTWSRLGNFYEDLSLEFKTMEFEGEVYQVNFIAFNTETHLPAFVSEVDRHLLYRWGGLLSGALLQAAQAAALASATISNPEASDALVNATTNLGDEEVKNIFLSEGGSRIATQLSDNYKRPITSRVHVNQDMRLLAVDPIYVKRK